MTDLALVSPPPSPPRARADVRVEPLPRSLTVRLKAAKATGPLVCPYCRKRSACPKGGRVYLCMNGDCPGGPEIAGQYSSILIIDALRGARLVPWREARRLNDERVSDPLVALRS